MLSYALHRESKSRVRTAVSGILPDGFLDALIAALMKALMGGCLLPVTTVADLQAAVSADEDGYLEEAIYNEFVSRHGRIGARLHTVRASNAIRRYVGTLTEADDGFLTSFQAEVQAENPNS